MAQPGYRHTQIGYVVIAGVLVGGGLGGAMCWTAALYKVAIAVFAVSAVVLALFGSLTISVDADALRFHLGVGLIRRTIPLSSLRTWRTVQGQWLFGWGIRVYPGGLLFNVSGFDAIELHLENGSQLRIGTDEPDRVSQLLTERLGVPAPLSASERAVGKRRTAGYVAFIVAVLVGVATMFWFQMQPMSVDVQETGFAVSGPMNRFEVPWTDVTSVELVDALPIIRARTNGFAAAGVLRGHFRLEDLGDGRLYVDAKQPPFVAVTLEGGPESFVFVNLAEPEQTRALQVRLIEAWEAAE